MKKRAGWEIEGVTDDAEPIRQGSSVIHSIKFTRHIIAASNPVVPKLFAAMPHFRSQNVSNPEFVLNFIFLKVGFQ